MYNFLKIAFVCIVVMWSFVTTVAMELVKLKNQEITLTDMHDEIDKDAYNLLKAAYLQDAKKVKSILENDQYIFIPEIRIKLDDQTVIVNQQNVVHYHVTDKIKRLFDNYNVSSYGSSDEQEIPSKLMLDCFFNNYKAISTYTQAHDTHRALNVAIDRDHEKCVEAIIRKFYQINRFDRGDHITTIAINPTSRELLSFKLLEQACYGKKLKSLESLLKGRYFHINAISEKEQTTLLDNITELAMENDSSYTDVMYLLIRYGARTKSQLEDDEESLYNVDSCDEFCDCIIS